MDEENKSESSAGINFNKANEDDEEGSSDEGDIIQDAMKKNRAKLEELD